MKCDNCYVYGCSKDSMARTAEIGVCIAYKPKEPKPTRYDKFRADTSTIDGFVEWLSDTEIGCEFCIYQDEAMKCVYGVCKAGIKAYFERTV